MPIEQYEALCEEHYERVVKTAYLLTTDRQEALDIAQETFMRALERWDSVSTMEYPEAWLHRVAANLAISYRRRLGRRLRRTEPEDSAPPPATPDTELAQALSTLTPTQRAVVVLRFYLDLSVADVAAALGKRPGTVRALTAQGIARLRETLREEIDGEVDPDNRPAR